ncbi:MAG: thioredoxin [Clostridiales bacterium]|nr:thioredoxin [Clostridiales bacterium]
MEILELTKQNFNDYVSNSNKPVMIDFWASWCGPCRMLAPIYEEIANELKDEAMFAKLNVDENAEVAGQYHVVSIPTIIVFKKGQVTARRTGTMSKEDILNLLEQ